MIQSANKYSIAALFEPESKVHYRIPRYQRAYSWSTRQWEDLYEDLSESVRGGHFFGSIICINRSTDALGDIDLELVDGQQRLITLSLLYAAIHARMLAVPREDTTDEMVVDRMNIQRRICLKNDGSPRLRLSHQKNNDGDYRAVLQVAGILKDASAILTSDMKSGSIYRAYNYFVKKVAATASTEFSELLDRVNRAEIVKIEVDSASDAFQLFESLNDRGMPLTAMDLIKNKALARIEQISPEATDEAAEKWMKMASRIPEAAKYQERFLRQAYNSRADTRTRNTENARQATRSNLIQVYEDLIDSKVNDVVEDLEVKSVMNQAFLHPEDAQGDLSEYRDDLTDILHVQAVPAYTVIYYLLMERNQDHSLISGVIGLLVKYFLRRNVTDFPPTRKLDTMLMDLIEYCRGKQNLQVSDVRDFLAAEGRNSSDKRFRECLENDIYEQNADAAWFILSSLERKHQTRETARDLWRQNGMGSFVWTIEHILPEGGNLPATWVDAIGGGDPQEAKRAQLQWMHKLGNLTLTAYNSELSNDPFLTKRDRKDADGKEVGYRNGIYLNTGLPLKESWTVADIQERTERLVDETMELFKM